jgi:hypothetical protein
MSEYCRKFSILNARCDFAPKEHIDQDQIPGCQFENTDECPLNKWNIEGDTLTSKKTGFKIKVDEVVMIDERH